MTSDRTTAENTWPDALYDVLRNHGYRYFTYVPDSGHQHLIERAHEDPDAVAIPLSNEGEGVGIAAGCHLGGGKAVLLTQSGGIGNCVNYFSLTQHCALPLLCIVTMRGDWGEQNPWQYPMGRAVEPVLAAMRIDTMRVADPGEVVATASAAAGAVDRAGRAVAILLTQRLLGVKKF
ncbi:thiamine pyrophosphate-binding protein [Mycolicibacterium sp.]|uniref:thiamine pyrophosphate-binding protein n=1 Tax=Mycolicibacterium sp. TaxID=2320850 RepID=UPI003D09A7EF